MTCVVGCGRQTEQVGQGRPRHQIRIENDQLQCIKRPRTHTFLQSKIVVSLESFVTQGLTGLCGSALESQQEQEQPRGAHTAGSSVNVWVQKY